MKYAELSELTGWKINTLRRLAASGIIFPKAGKFPQDEVDRILDHSFLHTWLDYCKTPHGIDSNRLRMTSDLHRRMMPNTPEGLTPLEQLYWLEHGLQAYPHRCVNCQGAVRVFLGFGKGYAEFCSAKCVRTSEVVRARVKNTVQQRYGVDNVSQLEEVKSKAYATVTSRFGGFFHPEVRTKTNIARYGVESPLWLPEVSARRKDTRHRNALEKLVYPDGFIPQFSEDDYLQEGSGRYSILHIVCGKTFTHRVPFTELTCRFCAGGRSSLERMVAEGIKHPDVQLGAPIPLEGKKVFADIKVGSLIVEVDGNYWHSELRGADKKKTSKRVKLLRQRGFDVMVFFEDEVTDRLEVVHSMINAKLGVFSRVFHARKCSVSEVSSAEARKFLDEHHIQGYANSSIHLGIFYEGALLGVASASKRRFGSGGYELVRLAFAKGTAVSGGTERLLKALKSMVPSLISYSDNRFGTGEVYRRLGTLVSENAESYFYLDRRNYQKRLSRLKFQKHRLSEALERFDASKTEWENMKQNGYDRIWDCGSRTWAL